MTYDFYTDGAATMKKVNGEYVREAGGWGVVLLVNDYPMWADCGHADNTTSNEMELTAIVEALSYYGHNCFASGDTINIYSDSAYCINIFTQWVEGWRHNGWTRGKKHEPIQNVEIIRNIYECIQDWKKDFIDVNFIKVKGHSGNRYNEYADQLAVAAKQSNYNAAEELKYYLLANSINETFANEDVCIRGKRRELPVIDDIGPDREELEEIIKPLVTYPCGRKLEITDLVEHARPGYILTARETEKVLKKKVESQS